MRRFIAGAGAAALLVATACRTNDAEPAPTNTTAPVSATAAPQAEATPPLATTMAESAAPAPAPSPAPTTPAAQTATPAPAPMTPPMAPDGVGRVNIAEAKARVDRGEAIIIDVRSADAYRESHIAGAKNIPLEELKLRDAEIPRDKFVITYCT